MAELKETARITVKLSPSIDVGTVPTGIRRIIPIVGGTISGPRISGDIAPIGADWNLVQPNGIMFISARYMIRTHDGAAITIVNEGWARIDDAAMAKIMSDEAPRDDEAWYCMLHTRFEAADPRYAWLNESAFICEMLPPPAADTVWLVLFELVKSHRAA